MAVYTPNLQLVRYEGETPRKLWEIKARSVPTLNNGDLVLLDATMAVHMSRKHGFKLADNSLLAFVESEGENFAGENQTSVNEETKAQDGKTNGVISSIKNAFGFNDNKQAEYKLPLASAISELSDEELNAACKYVGLATNKKVDTLRGLLLPYLPQE